MGHVVADSLEVARKVMFERKEEQIAFLKEEESKVDRLSAGITSYAIKLSTLQINEREHEEVAHMLQIVSDMERISDYCENISEFAESLLEKQVDFSEVGVEHLNKMLDVCIASYLYALEAFESNDRESALKTIEKETEADGLEISSAQSILSVLPTSSVTQKPEWYSLILWYAWKEFPTMPEILRKKCWRNRR